MIIILLCIVLLALPWRYYLQERKDRIEAGEKLRLQRQKFAANEAMWKEMDKRLEELARETA